MPPPPAAAALADAIRARRAELTRVVVDALYSRHPEWVARWGENGREATTRDTTFHFEFLEAAVRAGDDGIFARYTAWLADVLRSRRVPLEAVEESFDLMADAMRDPLSPDARATVAATLDAGRAGLRAAPVVPGRRAVVAHPRAPALLEALLAGDRRGAQRILDEAVDGGIGVQDMGDALVQPVMADLGRLWQENKVSVAQEHLATAVVQSALARAFARFELAAARGERALFACVEGNHHSLGLRIVADAFETKGWEVRYLGADVPTRDLVAITRDWSPHLVALSVSLPQHVASARRAIEQLRASGPVRVVVGGIPLNDHEGLASVVGADEWFPDAGSFLGAQR